ncbi:MAG TPA: FMN-binding protein, partial [Lachnospiraceae bacterium]
IKKREKKEENKVEPVKAEVPGQLKDGQYEGSAKGYGGRLTVLVTVKDGKIADIKVTSHSETPEYYASASSIIANIIKSNTPNVDSVSGATVSSNAIKSAVRDALSKAGVKIKSNDVAPKNVGSKAPADGRKAEPGNYSLGTQTSAEAGLEDGSYIGNGQGFGGNIRVRVTVSNGKVSGIEVLSHRDDSPYIQRAIDGVIPSILAGNTNVDTVGGATYSSQGIIEAVSNALAKAVKKDSGQAKKAQLPTLHVNAPKQVQPSKPGTPNVIKPIDENHNKDNIDDLLKPYYIDKPLADGDYIGYAHGYYKEGNTFKQKGIKSIVKIVNGEVESVSIPKNEFPDDFLYYERAIKVVNLLKGKNVRLFGAQMALFSDYTERIFQADNAYEKAKELLGEKYASVLKRASKGRLDKDVAADAVRSFMNDRLSTGQVFDTISAATFSGSGMIKSVRNAVENSSKDYETKNDVQDLAIVRNEDIQEHSKNIVLRANKKEGLDLSPLQVKIIKKEGKEEVVSFKDFKEKGLVIRNRETGKEIFDKMSLKDMDNFNVEIEHTKSKKTAIFQVQVGYFSKDYIVGLHYSKDGKNWYKVENLNMDKAEPNNISYLSQKIQAPESFRLKAIKIRVVSKSGKFYEYSSGVAASEGKEQRYELIKHLKPEDENYNFHVSPFMHIEFGFAGEESSKNRVEGDGQAAPDTSANEVVADAYTLATDMDLTGENEIYTHGVAIKPLKVFSRQKGVKIVEVQNLPKGLRFDSAKGEIIGIPEYEGDSKSPTFMEYNLTLIGENEQDKTRYVRKVDDEKNSSRFLKVYVTKDFDLDGLTGHEDENPLSFNARKNIQVLEVNGTEPTLKDYTDTLSNFPDSGVEVELKVKPDYKKVNELQKATLVFKVPSLKGREGYEDGRIEIFVRVKKAVEDKVKPAETEKPLVGAQNSKPIENKKEVVKDDKKENKKEEAAVALEKKESTEVIKEEKKEESLPKETKEESKELEKEVLKEEKEETPIVEKEASEKEREPEKEEASTSKDSPLEDSLEADK